jgi:hypothetical protein
MHQRAHQVKSSLKGGRDEDHGAAWERLVEAEVEDDWGTVEIVVEPGCRGSSPQQGTY